jgi:hypothetical protein
LFSLIDFSYLFPVDWFCDCPPFGRTRVAAATEQFLTGKEPHRMKCPFVDPNFARRVELAKKLGSLSRKHCCPRITRINPLPLRLRRGRRE